MDRQALTVKDSFVTKKVKSAETLRYAIFHVWHTERRTTFSRLIRGHWSHTNDENEFLKNLFM